MASVSAVELRREAYSGYVRRFGPVNLASPSLLGILAQIRIRIDSPSSLCFDWEPNGARLRPPQFAEDPGSGHLIWTMLRGPFLSAKRGSMRIVSWNVNSIRVRHDRLLRWLSRHRPEVLCLQETKTVDEGFPFHEVEALGYEAAVHGQKTYNGVAILSRVGSSDILEGLPGDDDDAQARLIAATCAGVRVICAYVPNGAEVLDPKYLYKLRWLRRLREHLEQDYDPQEPLVLLGDFNIAPDDRDVHEPPRWQHGVLCSHEIRARLQGLLDWGLCDTFRQHHDARGFFSWWDYRAGSFPRNDGLRIDLVLATASLAARCTSAGIDREEREGEKPSDHAPAWAQFDGEVTV